jgi:hypothetical protein
LEFIKYASRLLSNPTLSFILKIQTLKVLKLEDLKMDENHCSVVEMIRCRLTSAGTSSLVEVVGRNQGLTRLDGCYIDNFVLADGLHGNSSLKRLGPHLSTMSEVRNREVPLK